MLIGYAGVSTGDRNLELQWGVLTKAGCEMIFQKKASGIKTDRPEVEKMPDYLRKGDVVCIYKLDRLGRSLKNLLELEAAGARGRKGGRRSGLSAEVQKKAMLMYYKEQKSRVDEISK